MGNVLSIVTAVAAGTAAAFAQMPYTWARLAALGIGAGIASLHVGNVITPAASTAVEAPKGESKS